MNRDPQVDLIFSHFIPRYEATGVDPNDLRALMPRITQWSDWCRMWSEEGARHEALGLEALARGLKVTAAEAFVRAAIYYHYGKHLFADRPDEYRVAHEAMLRCYGTAAPLLVPPIERIEFPFRGVAMAGWLRKPRGVLRPPVAIILPGLDACKEELHAWATAFIDRDTATLTLDGPGQGETSFKLPVTHEWGLVMGAVIDVLEKRDDCGWRTGWRRRAKPGRALCATRRGGRAAPEGLHCQLRTLRLGPGAAEDAAGVTGGVPCALALKKHRGSARTGKDADPGRARQEHLLPAACGVRSWGSPDSAGTG
jgi:Esterase FrsA-like